MSININTKDMSAFYYGLKKNLKPRRHILFAVFAFVLYLAWFVITYQEVPSRTGYEKTKVSQGTIEQ